MENKVFVELLQGFPPLFDPQDPLFYHSHKKQQYRQQLLAALKEHQIVMTPKKLRKMIANYNHARRRKNAKASLNFDAVTPTSFTITNTKPIESSTPSTSTLPDLPVSPSYSPTELLTSNLPTFFDYYSKDPPFYSDSYPPQDFTYKDPPSLATNLPYSPPICPSNNLCSFPDSTVIDPNSPTATDSLNLLDYLFPDYLLPPDSPDYNP